MNYRRTDATIRANRDLIIDRCQTKIFEAMLAGEDIKAGKHDLDSSWVIDWAQNDDDFHSALFTLIKNPNAENAKAYAAIYAKAATRLSDEYASDMADALIDGELADLAADHFEFGRAA